jgi:AcrR family transcriptional regulator
MSEPRYHRRKEERPQEIAEAALAAFSEKGYAGTRVDEVAKRAGVSKGLLYLYFKTKEELFKAVVRSFVIPKIDAMAEGIAKSDMPAEEILRGPLTEFMKSLPGSPISVVVRLMISEGSKHPDLVKFYWDNVASRGIGTLQAIVDRGVQRGEFRRTAVNDMPHLLILPALFSVIFTIVFGKQSIDTDELIDAHIDIILGHLQNKQGITV